MPRSTVLTRAVALVGGAALVLAQAAAPLLVNASDHLDAPNIGTVNVSDTGVVSFATTGHEERDINDLYAFKGADAANTVLILTTNPAVNAGLSPATFGTNVRYIFNVDTNADATRDLAYVVTFAAANSHRVQAYTVTRYSGAGAANFTGGTAIASGMTEGDGATNGQAAITGGGNAYAGERSDPFFFDLLGFIGSVKGHGTRAFNDANTSDFFASLDTMGIVLEVPTTDFGATTIGVWATTAWDNAGTWTYFDQVGRPAINTVFNAAGADKTAFNTTPPSAQAATAPFKSNVVNTLEALSAGDTEGAYAPADATTIAGVLIPDILVYDTTMPVAGPLNGRALADDVIDGELNIVTGGFAIGGRNGTGAITGDGVAAHGDYLSAFPYLGVAHQPAVPTVTSPPTVTPPPTSTVDASAPDSGSSSAIAFMLAILAGVTVFAVALRPSRRRS